MLLHCIPRFSPCPSAVLFARRSSLRIISASFSSTAQSQPQSAAVGDNNDGTSIPQKQRQVRRRTRRRTLPSPDNDNAAIIPSLADFMHRAKVLKQYRNFVRLAQFVDGKDSANDNNPGECRAAVEEVRLSYKMGVKKGGLDALSKNMAYSEVRILLYDRSTF
mmetsp:Transcript_28559/g.60885  ORF Transcript_28559/g.60885 Transcript_28559/m.60885 type:complete len:163 (-) Transcript_28559:424-912(-)